MEEKKVGRIYDYVFKLIVIGEPAVGKSSMLTRYIDDKFYNENISTIGVDFKLKTVNVNGKDVKLNIWDTAGQERFGAVVENYFRGCKGALLVFSLGDAHSFQCVQKWLDRLEPHLVPITFLVGNKCDLEGEHRKVTTQQIEDFLDRYNAEAEHPLQYVETSALNGHNITNAFYSIAESLVSKIEEYKTIKADKRDNTQVFALQGVDPYKPQESADTASNKKSGCC